MKKVQFWLKPVINAQGELCGVTPEGNEMSIRKELLELAHENGECILYNSETNRGKRYPMSEYISVGGKASVQPKVEMVMNMSTSVPSEEQLTIHNSPSIKPADLIISDLKWKYLVRSALRGKNIMMVGAAGSGKTMAAKYLVDALKRPHFYFNLGATQDPRATLIGNTHFSKDTGTYFSESLFVKAIQTENAIILLDELSRAHPEAWNILMTVLDLNQRYLRLDEADGAPTIKVADGVTFIATANVGNEYTSTRTLDRALQDRFIIIEMDMLNESDEFRLLKMKHPNVSDELITAICGITSATRKEAKSSSGKITTSISTRAAVEMADLLSDGFTLTEVADVCIYPFFPDEGGVDSERTYVRQVVQKYIVEENTDDNLFNVDAEQAANIPF
jgi:hypothetical protein